MKFGMLIECDKDFGEAIEEATLAERMGFDSVWIAEHHNYDGYVGSVFVALAAIAARTERITIGPYVLIVPFYHPVHVAEDAAMLDRIARGRTVLGVGLGYVEEEFASFGIPYKERTTRLEEGVEVVRKLWTGDNVVHEGKHFRFPKTSIYPKPLQKPHPPIWVGAWVPKALERAARIGDAWVPGPTANLEQLRECYRTYRQARRGFGKLEREPEVPGAREVFVALTKEQAWEDAGRPLHQFYKDTYLGWPHPFLGGGKDMPVRDLFDNRFIIGTPDEAVRQIERFHKELGLNHLICRMRVPGITREAALGSLRLFAEEVIPALSSLS
jgi:probable F420-dependent oxidoreductase